MLIHDVEVEVADDGAVGLFAQQDGSCVLKVPFGMGDVEPSRALALLYKSFAVFRRTRRSIERLDALDGVERQMQDGLDLSDNGVSFYDAMGLDELFDRADPLHLLSLCERRALQSRDVYRHLERHLHLAVFGDDGVPHLERVKGPRREVRYGTADIVGLYCFVAEDFYRHFLSVDPMCAWGHFTQDALVLADSFRHRYLTSRDTLYSPDKQESLRTLQQLRQLLREINRNTSLRGTEYRLLYEALDRYLHSGQGGQRREGQIWGVRNFWAVWESICLYHAVSNPASGGMESFLTCDFEHFPPRLSTPELERRWQVHRAKVFSRNGIRRRPDLVLATETQVKVVDFKYYRTLPDQRPSSQKNAPLHKLERDFQNIEIYGLQINNHLLSAPEQKNWDITLEFWLPGTRASQTPQVHEPCWEPSLSVVTLPTEHVMENYSRLYDGLASLSVSSPAYI